MSKKTNPINPEIRDGRMREVIRELASEFIQRESNRTSLITVTDVTISDQGKQATIFMTVIPIGKNTGEDKEAAAVDFMKRQRADFRNYVQEKSRLSRIPFFDFAIDVGEKNRQKIDEISKTV
ncbi:MAG: Ribosome-binding factor [Candidatus Taylorbacteria bacterium]|nr:Ribosome-binding factor [Candidatus Taylorbacteria bacterium]